MINFSISLCNAALLAICPRCASSKSCFNRSISAPRAKAFLIFSAVLPLVNPKAFIAACAVFIVTIIGAKATIKATFNPFTAV